MPGLLCAPDAVGSSTPAYRTCAPAGAPPAAPSGGRPWAPAPRFVEVLVNVSPLLFALVFAIRYITQISGGSLLSGYI